jgi:tRNA uridine 5-carbamoylmethylation protein Kti12
MYLVFHHFLSFSFSFVQIYLHCPLEMALPRNAQRPASVNEDTIIKMFNHIEKPDPEKFSVTIDTNSSQSDNKW